MSWLRSHKNYFFASVFLSAILLLVVLFGMHPTDHEFINAMSYRISLGQHPYKDFEYVRPPLSLYLHSLSFHIFPENAILFSRIVFFFQMLFISFISCLILIRINYLKAGNILFYTLIFLLISLHNFPAMPWHTVDGLFFSLTCIYFLTNAINGQVIKNLFISGICCCLATLCKQNFLLIAPIIFSISAYLFRLKSFYFFSGFALALVLFLSFLQFNNLLSFYVNSSSDSATIFYIIKSIAKSLSLSSYVFFPTLIAISILSFFKKINLIELKFLVNSSLCIFLFLNVLEMYAFQNHVPKTIYQFLWVSSILIFISNISKFQDFLTIDNLIIIALYFIGLASMISWSYSYPLLYNAPFVAIVMKEYERIFGFIDLKKLFFITFIFWLSISNILYSDDYKFYARNNLGEINSKLNFIYTGDENFALYKNIHEISKNRKVEIVIPDFPLFSYLKNTNPDFKIDWFLDAETTLNAKEYLADMDGKIFIISDICFIQRDYHPKRAAFCELVVNNSELLEVKSDLSAYKFNRLAD